MYVPKWYLNQLMGSVDGGVSRYNGGGDGKYLEKVHSCLNSPKEYITRKNREL